MLLCYVLLTKIRVGLPVPELCPKLPDLEKFATHGTSIAALCCQLKSTEVDVQNVINWTVVG